MSSKIFSLLGLSAILAGASVACSGEGDENPEQLPFATGGYGAAPVGGAGGIGGAVTGGVTGGGVPGGGGAPSNGGAPLATGGTLSTGGALATGGLSATGGAIGSGGLPGSGGDPGAGGTLGSGGAIGSGGATGSGGGTERPDQGKGDGKDVIAIGDSWMSLGFDGIQVALVRASGQPYRTYGVAGTQLLNGQIPGQYTSAKRANPNIKTVVMTGGGNDVLLQGLASDCANGGTRCAAQLQKIAEGLGALWKQMSADGVQDMIHVMYAKDAGQGTKEDPAVGLKKVCDAVPPPMRCHLFATDSFVNGSYALDGIHPSAAAYGRIGKGVFDFMVANGIRR